MSSALEVHPVTRAIVDSQLRNTFADGLCIASVSGGQTLDPGLKLRARPNVPQCIQPLSKDIRFSNFDHWPSVASWLHLVNR